LPRYSPSLDRLSYMLERLKRVNLHKLTGSLELRRLHVDLLYCYKILFELVLVDLQASDFLSGLLAKTLAATSLKCTRKVVLGPCEFDLA